MKRLTGITIIFFYPQAVRWSIYGRPGASYLDLPGNMITGTIKASLARQVCILSGYPS